MEAELAKYALTAGIAGLQSFERALSRDLPAIGEWRLLADRGRKSVSISVSNPPTSSII